MDDSHAAQELTKKWSFYIRYAEVENVGRKECALVRGKDNVGGTTGANYALVPDIGDEGFFYEFDDLDYEL